MTKLEAMAYMCACKFMRDIKFTSTSWEQDVKEDPHLAEALRVLGIDCKDDTQSKTNS